MACAAWTYIFIRAYAVGFTHDECLSLQIVKGQRYLAATANNHLLNTWLMRLSYLLLGDSEFALRLPGVLSFGGYAYFAGRWVTKSARWEWTLLGGVLMLGNPYLLDFFSLARGYGMSLAFAMAALWYVQRAIEQREQRLFLKHASLSMGCAVLSAYACLLLLNLCIALALIIVWQYLRKFSFSRLDVAYGLASVALFLVMVPLVLLILKLKNSDELYFGGNEGFVANTVSILIHRSIYDSYYGEAFWQHLRDAIVWMFGLIGLVAAIRRFNGRISTLWLISALMVIASLLEHRLFNIPYPIERTSLIFLLLWNLLFWSMIEDVFSLFNGVKSKVLSVCLALMLIGPLSLDLSRNLNTRYAHDWKEDAHVPEMMQRLKLYASQVRSDSVVLSNTWTMEPSINYYRQRLGMSDDWIAHRSGVDSMSVYVICNWSDLQEKQFLSGYVIDMWFADNKTMLLKRRNS